MGRAMRIGLVQGIAVLFLLCASEAIAAEKDDDAGFDCHRAKTSVETAICSDASARKADADMVAAYRALRGALDPLGRERLRREQQAWLKRRTSDCTGPFSVPDLTSAGCVEVSTRERTAYLAARHERLTDAEGGQGPSLPPDQAYAICDEVERLTNEGKIQSRILAFDRPSRQEEEAVLALKTIGSASLRGLRSVTTASGTTKRLAFVMESGSCAGEDIIDYDVAASSGELDVSFQGVDAEDDEVLRWARWGMSDRLLMSHGQPVVVAANFFASPTRVRLASWLGSPRQTPLCAFRPSGKVVLRVQHDAPPECRALAAGNVAMLPWKPATKQEIAAVRMADDPRSLGGSPELVAFTAADLDGDGKPERIGLERLQSGAGCGLTRDFLSHIREDGARETESPLADALGDEEWGPTYPDEINTQQGRLSLFTFQGRTYLLGRHGGQTGVFHMDGGQLRQSCQLDVLPQIEIEKSYIPR